MGMGESLKEKGKRKKGKVLEPVSGIRCQDASISIAEKPETLAPHE